MSHDLGAIHYVGADPAPAGAYDVWQLYGLDQLWEMVRDEDGVASFTQVGAWHRMAELCSEQADQLQRALDQLMVHWPARPGSAAELFRRAHRLQHRDRDQWRDRDHRWGGRVGAGQVSEIVGGGGGSPVDRDGG